MRVLLVGPTTPGGEGAYMTSLRRHPPAGVDYESVGGFGTGAPGVRCHKTWEVALNRLVRPSAVPDMGFRALSLRDQFDLIHVHAHPVRLDRLGDTPLVMSEGSSSAVYLHDYLGWDDARLASGYRRARRLYRALRVHDRLLALDRVDRAYVFSRWARELNVRWGADPQKLEVIEPGFPVPAETARERRDAFTFLFLGTDFERKGGFDVVEAFDRLRRENLAVHLVIAGSDPAIPNPDRSLHAWVDAERRARVLAVLADLQRAGRVTTHHAVDPRGVRENLYPRADAFVMPTLAEGFGFTNIEAMSHGVPVISSRLGPIQETVGEDGEAGHLVPPGDVGALEDAMGRLSANREAAQAMGAVARRRFLERFTIEEFQRRLGDFYRRATTA
jgi:glycosyltransferase involved in cell wall biosynthesis